MSRLLRSPDSSGSRCGGAGFPARGHWWLCPRLWPWAPGPTWAFFVLMRLSGVRTLGAGCVEELCPAGQRVGTGFGKDGGQGGSELWGALLLRPQPAALLLVLADRGPQGSLPCSRSWQHAAAPAILFPCSFPAFPPALPERTKWGGQPGRPAVPCAGAMETRVPAAGAGSVAGRSCPAVVVEDCILVEHLGNGARPHLRHARPVATAEPARRHDGGWHLCIFSFCCIALGAGNEGCGHAATGAQQPMLCAAPAGTAAAGEGGSAAR